MTIYPLEACPPDHQHVEDPSGTYCLTCRQDTYPRGAHPEWEDDGEEECDHEWIYRQSLFGETLGYCIRCGADFND